MGIRTKKAKQEARREKGVNLIALVRSKDAVVDLSQDRGIVLSVQRDYTDINRRDIDTGKVKLKTNPYIDPNCKDGVFATEIDLDTVGKMMCATHRGAVPENENYELYGREAAMILQTGKNPIMLKFKADLTPDGYGFDVDSIQASDGYEAFAERFNGAYSTAKRNAMFTELSEAQEYNVNAVETIAAKELLKSQSTLNATLAQFEGAMQQVREDALQME